MLRSLPPRADCPQRQRAPQVYEYRGSAREWRQTPTEHANTRAERRTRNVQRTTHSAERTQADGCNVPHTRRQQQAGDYSKSGSATTCNSLACTTWLLFSQLTVLLLRLTIDQRVHLRDSVSNPSCAIRTAIALLPQRSAQQHRAHPDATCNECARACQSVRLSVVAGHAHHRHSSSSGRQRQTVQPTAAVHPPPPPRSPGASSCPPAARATKWRRVCV